MKKQNSFSGPRQPAKSRGFSRAVWTAAICVMALLVFGLAALQYKWNIQIRNAAEVRVGADLESEMLKWQLNLYREFSTICIALQVGPDSGAQDHWNDYLRRYESWRSAASRSDYLENIYSNPDVVSNVYIYETSRGTNAPLFVLDTNTDQVQQSNKPVGFEALFRRLEQHSANLPLALRAWMPDDSIQVEMPVSESGSLRRAKNEPITGWQFDESIPAIVHPIVHRRNNIAHASTPVDWIIVVLSHEAITRKIFPELTRRYFADSGGLEYRLAVLSTSKTSSLQYSRLLYSSEPNIRIDGLGDSDSIMDIFGPPPESTEGSFWQITKHRESLRGEEWRDFSAPVWFPVFQQKDDVRNWVLFLKRRNGPLAAAITKAWLGNLIVGNMILLMLAASMFLVLIASRRERTLAKMQLDFVTSISHELRTPLSGILAAGQNLTDGYAPDLPHYGGLITAQARVLIDLVDQIVLFAALNDGKKKYQLTAVGIDEVLNSLRETTIVLLEDKGFHVGIQVEQNLPRVLGDKQALVRCIRNLVENAAKYSGKSRWIGISVEREGAANPNTGIKVTVADHGVGIAPSEIQHIFEPFYRSLSAITAQIHGSGLGLSVVKHIVEEMYGTVTVTSKVGEGTIFVLHLRSAENSVVLSTTKSQEAEILL